MRAIVGGAGVGARRAALRVQPRGIVAGLDVSSEMLAVARAEAQREGVSVDWHESRAVEAGFPNPAAFLAGEIDVDTAAIPAMQGLTPEARRALAAAIEADMTPALQSVTRGDEVLLPFHAHVATATAA